MDILAMDSSAVSASAAYMRDGKILGQYYINAKLTHSTTLMHMVEHLLESARLSLNDVDYFAVAVGPGSFTGLRIGIAAVKGLSLALNKPCIPVSTLEAIAYNYVYTDTYICAVMDARCNQFFNALFKCSADGTVQRLCDDRAIAFDALADELNSKYSGVQFTLVGDGAQLAYKLMSERVQMPLHMAAPHLMYQQSSSVALVAQKLAEQGKSVTSQQLLPSYLRLPQAQQELRKKLNSKQ